MFNLAIVPSLDCPSNCSYCRGPNAASKLMSVDTVKEIVKWINNFRDDHVFVTFHGGEPLLAGYEFYEKVLPMLKEELSKCEPDFAIQSNLWRLSDRLAQLFNLYNVKVGSSLDGPSHINDVQRGEGYFKKTMHGYRIARANHLDVNFLCTFSKVSMDYIDEILDFFLKEGLPVRLNAVLPSLRDDNSNKWVISPEDYLYILVYIWGKYLDNHDKMEIKSLDQLVKTVYYRRGTICTFVDCMGDFFAVGPDGNIWPCYRLVGMPDYILGNIYERPTEKELSKSHSWKIFHDYKKLADHKCYTCQHLDYCRGGCPYNTLIQKNNFVGIDPYCKTYKRIFDEIIALKKDRIELFLTKY